MSINTSPSRQLKNNQRSLMILCCQEQKNTFLSLETEIELTNHRKFGPLNFESETSEQQRQIIWAVYRNANSKQL